jgi:drug/metabolite transporter (DMT)-like permease
MSAPSQDGSSLLTTLLKSLAAVGALSVGAAARRAASTAGGYAIVALLFAVSLCFLTFAGYRALEMAMGSIQASLIVGCAYLFLALVAALVLQVRRR